MEVTCHPRRNTLWAPATCKEAPLKFVRARKAGRSSHLQRAQLPAGLGAREHVRAAEVLRAHRLEQLLQLLRAVLLQRVLSHEAAHFGVRLVEARVGDVQLAVEARHLPLQRVAAPLRLVPYPLHAPPPTSRRREPHRTSTRNTREPLERMATPRA